MKDEDEFTEYRDKNFNWYKVLNCLCRPRAFWTFKGYDDLHFSSSELSRYGKLWYYFICAKFCHLYRLRK